MEEDRTPEDFEYFAGMDKVMAAGGREALMHFLMNRDLSGFNVRKMPATPFGFEHQVEERQFAGAVVVPLPEGRKRYHVERTAGEDAVPETVTLIPSSSRSSTASCREARLLSAFQALAGQPAIRVEAGGGG